MVGHNIRYVWLICSLCVWFMSGLCMVYSSWVCGIVALWALVTLYLLGEKRVPGGSAASWDSVFYNLPYF